MGRPMPKFPLLPALASILIVAIFVVGGIRINDYSYEEGNIYFQKSHDLFFEYASVSYPASVRISSAGADGNITIGFSSDTDKLDFGTAVSGESIHRRFINLTNNENARLRVLIEKTGNISPMLSFSSSSFTLEEGETRQVSITLDPDHHETGFYEGRIEVIYKKPRMRFISFLI